MSSCEKLREIPSTFSLKDLYVINTVPIRRQDYERGNYEADKTKITELSLEVSSPTDSSTLSEVSLLRALTNSLSSWVKKNSFLTLKQNFFSFASYCHCLLLCNSVKSLLSHLKGNHIANLYQP